MNLSDKDLLSSGLFAVKHMTMVYNDLASQTDDQQLARELCEMIGEEHNARIRLFEAMRQRGWYNPQLIDDQQLRQTQQKIQQQLQQTTAGQHTQTGWQTGQYQQTGYPQTGYQQTGYQQTGYQQAGYQQTNTGQYQPGGWQQTGQYQMAGNQFQAQHSPQFTNMQTGIQAGRISQ